MLEYFHLNRPWWLLALLPVVAIAILWSRKNSGQSKWTSAISGDLLKVLLEEGVSKTKRWFSSLVVGALILVTIGLSGPAWQKLPQEVEQKQDTLIILLDLSLSMFADDVKPSRVERARQKIAKLI